MSATVITVEETTRTLDSTITGCPLTINGLHDVTFMPVPAHEHNGVEVMGAHERGFCWNCDQRFTR